MSAAFDWPALRAELERLPGAVVAFSGGVDSTVLLAACREVLGADRVLAVIADSASLARTEIESARQAAAALGVRLEELSTAEIDDPRYRANTGDRCFWCKEALFGLAQPVAAARGWALLYGENADDVGDHRPGARSAATRGVRAPLRDAGWTKAMIRAFARDRGLSAAEKPAMPCLASRVAVGQAVDVALLGRIEALEGELHRRGYAVVRARHLSTQSLRLEFGPEEFERARAEKAGLISAGRRAGWERVEIAAYRRGSVALPGVRAGKA